MMRLRHAPVLSLGLLVCLILSDPSQAFLPWMGPAASKSVSSWVRPSTKLYISGGDYNLFGGKTPPPAKTTGEYDLLGGSKAEEGMIQGVSRLGLMPLL